MSDSVPKPPEEQVVIEQQDPKRLQDWISFFKNLSPRVRVLEPGNAEFLHFYLSGEEVVRRLKQMQEDYILLNWPKREGIAFIIQYDTSLPKQKPVFEPENAYIFCFGSHVFGLGYFSWDGDAEQGDWATTYSLSDYSESALRWDYIKKIIMDRIAELERQVPEFK